MVTQLNSNFNIYIWFFFLFFVFYNLIAIGKKQPLVPFIKKQIGLSSKPCARTG